MANKKVCIVGAGRLSSRRIYPYIGTVGASVAGVCDLDISRAEEKTRLYGGKAFSDMQKMLEEVQPDGVIICVGPSQHAVLAKQAMEMGVSVYTEKPPALTASDAFEVFQVSQKTGVPCMTGFKKRYAAAYQRAHEWISKFPADDRLSISADYASAAYRNDDDTNSFLLDFAIHVIDLTVFLFGDVEKVFAFSKGRHAFAVSLKFTNGAVGSLNLNDGRSFSVPTEEVEITLSGGNFMTVHNSSSWRVTENQKPVEWREPPTFVSGGDSGEDTGHLTELAAFVGSLGTSNSRPSDIYESYKSMVVYEAIKQSAETGTLVDVQYAS